MPANKNQHYVPRCYFKPFTVNGDGNAINLVNITSGRCVNNAPTRSQCAKKYLYGRDLRLEHILQNFEGHYASILNKIMCEEPLVDAELEALRSFAWLQHCRTEMAFSRLAKAKELMHAETFRGYEDQAEILDLSEERVMQFSILQFTKTLHVLRDLSVRILHNRTREDFIIGDDPAIHTNRFLLQRRGIENVGIGSAGTLLFLPLTPKHMLICYDKDVYHFAGANYSVKLERSQDVQAFNQFQLIKAEKNIYHFSPSHSEFIIQQLEVAQSLRPQVWHKIQTNIVTREEAGRTFIRPVSPEVSASSRPRIISLGNVVPKPERWPRIIKFKLRPAYYYDGSLAGYLRFTAARDMRQRNISRR